MSTTIHNSSFHPRSHKIAAYKSMVHRAIAFSISAQDLSSTIIFQLLNEYTRKQLSRCSSEEKKFVPIKFITFAPPIANYLRKHNYATNFSTDNNM